MENIVWVKNLTKKFGDFTAVNQINFQIKKGEIFGFLGPNGAGKSTTIRMLCGILKPTSGEGKVSDYEINLESEKIKEKIGYMSQKFSLYDDLTVKENIEFYSGIYSVLENEKKERLNWIIDFAGLRGKENMLTGILSGGWRQRLALGCALIHKPEVLFLDEPTSGVDPISRKQFWEIIQNQAKSGITILVTTHYLEEANYCSRLALIYKGKIIALNTPSELKNNFPKVVMRLKTKNLVEIIEILKNNPHFINISIWEGALQIILKEENSQNILEKILKEKQIIPLELKKTSPSLEDVFVYLVNQADEF